MHLRFSQRGPQREASVQGQVRHARAAFEAVVRAARYARALAGHAAGTPLSSRHPALHARGCVRPTRHRLPSPGREGRPAWKSRCAPSFARGPVGIPSPSRVTRGPRFPPSSWATRGPRFPPPAQLNSRAFSALAGNLPLLARIWSRARPWPIARGGEWRSCSDWPGRVARSFRW